MTVKSSFFLLVLVILCLNCNLKNTSIENQNTQQDFLRSNAASLNRLQDSITTIFKEKDLVGDFILGVVNENGLVYTLPINQELLEGKPSPLDENALIYLGSHTKSFTATMLRVLAEEGKIDLSKSVFDYVPELDFGGKIDTKSITMIDLLNHTHGVNSTKFTWKTAYLGYSGDFEELIEDFNRDFVYDSTRQFLYSNTGPVLAALIMEKVTGLSWKKQTQEKVFQPLGMNRSGSNVSQFDLKDIRPAVAVTREHEVVRSGFYKKDIIMSPAGGTLSTVNDLAKWLQANINKDQRLFQSEQAWADMHQPTTNQDRTYFTYKRHAYSLGWDIATYEGDTILTRFGVFSGIMFHASFMPSKKLGIIAFSSDPRAGALPHLAANYAYSLINQNPNAEINFIKEKDRFNKGFSRSTRFAFPEGCLPFTVKPENDYALGTYVNQEGWPEIQITKEDNSYVMQWGVQNGKVYQIPEAEQPLIGILGPLNRSFKIEGDKLYSGSLIFKRVK